MKNLAGSIGVVGALLVSSSAGAAPLGTPGQLSLSAERLFGYSTVTETETDNDTDVEVSDTISGFGALSAYPSHPLNLPRLGIDYFPIAGLTLGGSITFMTYSTSREVDGTEGDGASTTIFSVSPRIGYALMFTDMVGLWPRGGITYYNQSTDIEITNSLTNETSTVESSRSETALTLEAHLVIAPIDHVGITVGPTLDIGLSGSGEMDNLDGTTNKSDLSSTVFGIQAGLAVWF